MAEPREHRGEEPALTYFALRRAIGLVGLALPIVLFVAGMIDGHLELSISAYYYTNMRDYFTGTMCVLGVFLFCYRFGAMHIEAWLTKIAGLSAFGVAFFHAAPAEASLSSLRLSNVHVASAGVLLVILGVISFWFFADGQSPRERSRHEAVVYRLLGLIVWLSIVAIIVLNVWFSDFGNRHQLLFWLESIAVISFSVSFLIKGEFVQAFRSRPSWTRRDRNARPTA